MAVSRRPFLKASLSSLAVPPLLLAGWPRRALAATSAVRLPLEQFVQDDELLGALVEGVRVMKARVPSDPTSWFFQAAMHGVTEEAIAQAKAGDPGVTEEVVQRFWNQCPHFGQSSANFLIWHRAYLFYFERILRAAAGKPDLAVPYWNYTEEGQRGFPALFAPENLPQTGAPNPLHHPNRELAFTSGRLELTEAAVDTSAALGAPGFFGADEMIGFAGGIADDNPGTQGVVERRPHNQIHFAVGGVIGDAAGAMAQVEAAAFDPIFWPHHSNIDRLWVRWSCLPGKTWGALSPDNELLRAWLDSRPWFFHDADGSVKNETRRFYMDPARLGYRYADEDPACEPLRLPEVPVVVAAAEPATDLLSMAVAARREDEIADRVVELEAAAGRLATTTLELPGLAQVAGGRSVRTLAAEAAGPSSRRVLLELQGLEVEGVPSAGFDVYVNAPQGATPDRSSPAFVGTVALFGLDHRRLHRASGPGEAYQSFDITEALALADASAQAIRVDIVPFDLLQPVEAGQESLRRPDQLRVRRMRVLVVEQPPAVRR